MIFQCKCQQFLSNHAESFIEKAQFWKEGHPAEQVFLIKMFSQFLKTPISATIHAGCNQSCRLPNLETLKP